MSSSQPSPRIFNSSQARNNFITESIGSARFQAFSGTAILRSLRNSGVQIRTQTFFSLRREVLGLTRFEESIRGLRPDTYVPRAWISERPNLKLSQLGQYRIKLDVFDGETGEPDTIFRAIATDKYYTSGQAMDHMRELIAGPLAQYNISIESMELYQVWSTNSARLTT